MLNLCWTSMCPHIEIITLKQCWIYVGHQSAQHIEIMTSKQCWIYVGHQCAQHIGIMTSKQCWIYVGHHMCPAYRNYDVESTLIQRTPVTSIDRNRNYWITEISIFIIKQGFIKIVEHRAVFQKFHNIAMTSFDLTMQLACMKWLWMDCVRITRVRSPEIEDMDKSNISATWKSYLN